jgi:hypothetical protein
VALRLCDGSGGVRAPRKRSSLNDGCGGVGAQHRCSSARGSTVVAAAQAGLAMGSWFFCFSSDLQRQEM